MIIRDQGEGSQSSREVTVALAQVTGAPYAVEENRALTVQAARSAFERGADVVVLPELIVPGYVANRERLITVAEPLDGPSVETWRQLAKEAQGFVVGGFCECDGGALYNSAVVVGPARVVLHYRKLHLFREEKQTFAPGDRRLPVAPLPFGTVGLCICYDLRFVETVRILALQGAELICVPTAWVPGYDEERWDDRGLCPQAQATVLQANLNQVFIACASQAGGVAGSDFLGSSIIADPYGKVALGPLPGTEPGVACGTIDLAASERAQVRDPLIRPRSDRRTDVYGVTLGDVKL